MIPSGKSAPTTSAIAGRPDFSSPQRCNPTRLTPQKGEEDRSTERHLFHNRTARPGRIEGRLDGAARQTKHRDPMSACRWKRASANHNMCEALSSPSPMENRRRPVWNFSPQAQRPTRTLNSSDSVFANFVSTKNLFILRNGFSRRFQERAAKP